MSKATSGPVLSEQQVQAYANTLIASMETPAFHDRLAAVVKQSPSAVNPDDLLNRVEEVQAEFLEKDTTSSSAGASGDDDVGAVSASAVQALSGSRILEQLRDAVTRYPSAATEQVITRLCEAVEATIAKLVAMSPALKQPPTPAGPGHAHAHAQAQAHGPSTMANPSPQMRQMMEVAMSTLRPEQRATLERAQRTMMNGSPPSAEDMKEMMMIQRQVAAFIHTMQNFNQGSTVSGGGQRK